MFETLGHAQIGFNDLRANGMLLPANNAAALRLGIPLHLGPHPRYSGMVMERVGGIEAIRGGLRLRHGLEAARNQALMQLRLLQRALLLRRLRGGGKGFALKRSDPLAHSLGFSELDAMVDSLWTVTATTQAVASFAESSSFAI